MMWRRIFIVCGVIISSAAGALLLAPDRASPPAHAETTASAASAEGPAVALLVTKAGALHTSLYIVRPGAGAVSTPVATFSHPADAAVQGAVVPGTQAVLAIAEDSLDRDKSFNSVLVRLSPHAPPERLCDSVVFGTTPLVMPTGRAFVARGKSGVLPKDASITNLRVDELSVEEIDPGSGALRTIHTYSGYLAFPAGAWKGEVLVYRVARAGADIVAVDADTGKVRVIVPSLPPFARDFSVDAAAGALVFRGRDEARSRVWTIERFDLASGARTRLYEGPSMTLSPHVWPGGGVAFNAYEQSGLSLLGSGSSTSVAVNAPLGRGIDVLVATSPDGVWVAADHTLPSALPVPFALNTRTGQAAALPAPSGARAVIAGFVGGEGVSR